MAKSCYGCNESNKKKSCINNGKYCPILSNKSKFNQDDPVFIQKESGPKDIIIESLRENVYLSLLMLHISLSCSSILIGWYITVSKKMARTSLCHLCTTMLRWRHSSNTADEQHWVNSKKYIMCVGKQVRLLDGGHEDMAAGQESFLDRDRKI